MFALAGPEGAALQQAIVYAAGAGLKVLINQVDRIKDGHNDWWSTFTINLAGTFASKTEPGFYAFLGDNPDSLSEVWLLGHDRAGDGYTLSEDVRTLVHAGTGHMVTDAPWLVAFVDGSTNDDLKKWKATAVGAANLAKFFGTGDTLSEDVGSLFDAYNDTTMALEAAKLDQQSKASGLPDDEKKNLEKDRDARLANIQNEDFKSIVDKLYDAGG